MAKKKTPSPRVIAAKLLVNVCEGPYFRSAGEMGEIADTKVSEEKREKVIQHLNKLTEKFQKQIKKIIANFENPPPRKQKAAAPLAE